MGRPRKVTGSGIIDENPTVEMDPVQIVENETVKEVRREYIKNGVTILRYQTEEKELLAQGWARK